MSIKKDCQYCGKQISLRKMPEGHWLAFDYGSSTVHECVKKKKSNPKPSPKTNANIPKGNNNIEKENIGEVLQLLQVAINNSHDVNMKYYTDYRKEWTTRVVTPFRIYSKDNSTYLEAYCHWRKEDRTFKVSRISYANIVTQTYKETAATKEPATSSNYQSPSSSNQNNNNYAMYSFWAIIVIIIIYFLNK